MSVASPLKTKNGDRRTGYAGPEGHKYSLTDSKRFSRGRKYRAKKLILEMYEKGELSHVEIAEKAQVSKGTVYNIIKKEQERLGNAIAVSEQARRAVIHEQYMKKYRQLEQEYEYSKQTSKGKRCKGDTTIVAMQLQILKSLRELHGVDVEQKQQVENKTVIDWSSIIIAQRQLMQLPEAKEASNLVSDPIEDKIKSVTIHANNVNDDGE